MEIDNNTRWFGVIGNPVEHSLSPAIHNAAFQKVGFNAVYLALRVESIGDALKGVRALGNASGFSVTIPHKMAAIPFLDEIEPTAKAIGAINTIVVEQGKLKGHNTDASGALQALREGGALLEGQRVLLLGSGGAARAVAFALVTGSNIPGLTVLGVDDAERQKLVKDLRAKTAIPVEDATLSLDMLRYWIPHVRTLIHCTPVGMFPKGNESCVPHNLLRPELTVMDVVYNPRDTKLMLDAKAAGCRTIQGLEMFLNQAAQQFELWVNRPAPIDVMRTVLESRFQ
jgi:shikimate dehydrogenase